MIDTIHFKIIPKREIWNFTSENRDEVIGNYLKKLKNTKKVLKDMSWELWSILKMKFDETEIFSNIDDEIKLCEFYFEYKKKSKDKDFNKWIKLTADHVNKEFYFIRRNYKEDTKFYFRRNGRVRVLIIVEKNEKTTKVSLNLSNDSKFIWFLEDDYKSYFNEVYFSHLKSEDSILKKVEEYKNLADTSSFKIRNPYYSEELRQAGFLNVLLQRDKNDGQ